MKRLAILLSGLALSALPCTSALASDLTFNFSGATFSATGDLTYSTTGTAGQYLVTAASGTATYAGSTYSLMLLPINNFAGNDNLFFNPSPTAFDFNGVALSLVGSPNYALSLYNIPPDTTDYELLGVNGGAQIATQTEDFGISLAPPTVTPEPGSLALLGTGAFGVVGLLRRKFSV